MSENENENGTCVWRCPDCGKLHAEATLRLTVEWEHETTFDEDGSPVEFWDPNDKDYPGECTGGGAEVRCAECLGSEEIEDYWTDLRSVVWELRGRIQKLEEQNAMLRAQIGAQRGT